MPNTAKPTAASAAAAAAAAANAKLKHKRRFCRIEGCTRIVKSQGVCQRHGAKPRLCKIEGCKKQAQGNFDKMCKSHFKAMKRMTTPIPKVDASAPPPGPQGFSVYDSVLPAGIAYVPQPGTLNPLVAHLKAGFDQLKPPAWHRNEERRARGLIPIDNPAAQLEAWERELVWMEILVLTGAPKASFRHLARAWGRDKGFHMVLAQFICERQGDVRRKPRQQAAAKAEKKKKKKNTRKSKKSAESIPDDLLEDYDDAENNFADDIFNFTVEEFEVITSKWSNTYAEVSSETTSDTPAESPPQMAQAAPPVAASAQPYNLIQQPQQQQTQQAYMQQAFVQQQQQHQLQQQLQTDPLHLIPPNEHNVSNTFF